MNSVSIGPDQSYHAVSDAWVVVASLYQARLLRFHSPLRKSCQLEERGRIEAPMPASAYERYADASVSADQPYRVRYQQLQKGYQRFARQLTGWVRDMAREHAIEKVTVFAPAQMMEWLEQLAAELSPVQADLRTGNLMDAYDDALCRHPDILALIQRQRPGHRDQTPAAARLTRPRITDQQSTDKRLRKDDRPWRVFTPIPTAVYRQ